MLKQAMALLAPVALMVAATACGDPSSYATGVDEQGNPVESSSSAIRQGGQGGGDQGGGSARGPGGGGGGQVGGGGHEHGPGGGQVGGGGHEHGPGGHAHGNATARSRRGWDNDRWAPGWGWSNGQWIVGGASQFTCVTDDDCIGPLGPGVAVCSFDPTVALGYCIAPSWF